MSEKIITVEIDDKGDFSLDLEGFKGKGCKDIAKLFEQMGKVKSEVIKTDYNQEQPNKNVVKAGQ
jgi:hypothetical protein